MMRLSFLFALLSLVGVSGCGGGGDTGPRLETVPVAGTVTLDGNAFGPGTIELVPAEGEGGKTRVATGSVNEQGSFRLGSYEAADGAVPGVYVVRVTKDTTTDPSALTATEVESFEVTIPAEGADDLKIDLISASAPGAGSLLNPKLNTGPDTTSIPATL